MEITETMTRDQFGEILEKENEVTYSIVQHEDRWAILIENGIFNNFKYVILNMRLRYEDEDEEGNTQTKIVDDINAVIDKELALDFEYDLVSVPSFSLRLDKNKTTSDRNNGPLPPVITSCGYIVPISLYT